MVRMTPLAPTRDEGGAGAASASAARPRSEPLGTRQEHLRSLSIAWQLARLDLVRRYTATMLGLAWAVASPLLMAAVIGLVFARLFGVPIAEFLPYLFLNLTLWSFFVACLDSGAIAFIAAEGYIKQIPRVAFFTYPLRMVFAAFVTLALGLVAAAIVSFVFGNRPSVYWIGILPALGVWFLFGFAIACISGVLNTAVRDFQYIQSVGVQALFYATPVMFPADLLVEHGLQWMLTYNPLYHLMMLVCVPLLINEPATLPHWIAAAITLAAVSAFAIFAMRVARPRLVYWL
ncbi:MAG: ABC transporter permease [Deltaproteobacteria bacterium]|nr:ABC transporter permease [Deltaproteobacteria bacterium]